MRHTTRIRRAAIPPSRGLTDPGRRRGGGPPPAAGLLIAGVLLTGCGAQPASPGAAVAPADLPSAVTPGPTPAATPSLDLTPSPGPSAAAAPTRDASVTLPWPAADASTAADLQRSVDGGAEPWLLDPAEVAVSYATAAHGWSRAEARPDPGGTTVEVSEGARKLTLTLRQPGRTGPGGIWVVTAETAR